MTKIDFTQPLEHVDGTPVKLDTSQDRNPDSSGDYYLVREDGEDFTPAGTNCIGGDKTRVLIRNRQPDFWGPEIEVNGVKPTWLRPEDRVRWYGPGMTDQWWNRNASDGIRIRGVCWHATIKAIRLPADHFAYKAIAAGFEPWGGGKRPDDYDPKGGILFRNGKTNYGDHWGWAHDKLTSPDGSHHIIGYRKKVVTQPALVEEIDWTGDLEAYHTDGRVVPVRLTRHHQQPDEDGDYVTTPKTEDGSDCWHKDGSNWGGSAWRIRNRAAVKPVDPAPEGYGAIGDWVGEEDGQTPPFPADIFYQMRATDSGWVNPKIISTTVTVPVLTVDDIAAAEEAWGRDDSGISYATFLAQRWGLLTPKPTPLDRFMAVHPEADRATAELALGWEQGQ